MCGPIYNTYRGCGHKLDSGEVEPCEDGIISNNFCRDSDGKLTGDVFDQVVHTRCPSCEKEQQELDEGLDSPNSSWISGQQSRASKGIKRSKAASQQQTGSQRSVSTARTTSTRSRKANSDDQASTRLTARQTGKRPASHSQQYSQTSSAGSSSPAAGDDASEFSKTTSRASLSQALPSHAEAIPQQQQHANDAATSTSKYDEDARSESTTASEETVRPLPKRSSSIRRAQAAGSEFRQAQSAISSVASTLRSSRASHASSDSASASSHRRKHSSRLQQSDSSLAGSDYDQASEPRQDKSVAHIEYASTIADESEPGLRQVEHQSNLDPRIDRNEQSTRHLQEARNDLRRRMSTNTARGSTRSKPSLMTRVFSRNKQAEHNHTGEKHAGVEAEQDDHYNEQPSPPAVERMTEVSTVSGSRAADKVSTQTTVLSDRTANPSYIHPNDHPSKFASSQRPRRRRGETYEQMAARRLKQEQEKAAALERDIQVAREDLHEAEDAAFARDTRRAIEQSQSLSPHEQWQEDNLLRQAVHASLRHHRDILDQASPTDSKMVTIVHACGHRTTESAALDTDPDGPVPRFIHQKARCKACERRQQQQQQQHTQSPHARAGTSDEQLSTVSAAKRGSSDRDTSLVGQSQHTRRGQYYEPTESPTMASSERAAVRRPPPSFASARQSKPATQRAPSVAPSTVIPVEAAMEGREREEASRRRLFEKKNQEYEEYKRQHGDDTSSVDN